MKERDYIIAKIRDLERRLDEDMPEMAKQFMRGELVAYENVAEIRWLDRKKLGLKEPS